jgi:hypothetical protein
MNIQAAASAVAAAMVVLAHGAITVYPILDGILAAINGSDLLD